MTLIYITGMCNALLGTNYIGILIYNVNNKRCLLPSYRHSNERSSLLTSTADPAPQLFANIVH